MSQLLLYLSVALAGLTLGVAVNALADRIAGDEEPPWQAATCAKCRAALPGARLLPVAPLLAGRNVCPACGTAMSPRRPLLSLALAVAFPLLLARVLDSVGTTRLPPAVVFGIDAATVCALALIFAVDLEHRLIFDLSIYLPLAALVLTALVVDRKALAAMLFGVLICGGLFLLLYVLGYVVYHEEALGFGDVKLAVLIGVIVGWPAITTALVLAALSGAAVSMLLIGLGTATRRTYIPFGVFLAGGAVLALLLTPPFW